MAGQIPDRRRRVLRICASPVSRRKRTHMKLKRPRVAATVIGCVAALAMAVAGVAAVSLAAAGRQGAARRAHVATAAKAELSAKARVALTRILREGYKPSAELVKPGEVKLKAGASGTTSVGSYNWSGDADRSDTG